jgi:glycine cleavage system aminomethyltransferase T
MEPPVAQSALHAIYRLRAARMEVRGRWLVPADFGSVDYEVKAARTRVGQGERCGAGVLELEGEAVGDLAMRLGVGDAPVGAAVPLALTGISEARWCRLTRGRSRVLVGTGSAAATRSLLEMTDTCLHITDLSPGLTTLVILGPRSPDLLARLVRIDVDPRVFADRTLALTGAVGIPLQLLRWDCGAVLAYELTVGRDVAEYFWGSLVHVGEYLDVAPIGAEALSRLQYTV